MRKMVHFLIIIVSVLFITGCSSSVNDTKELADFKEIDITSYTLSDEQLSLDIDVCNSKVEITSYDGVDVELEIAYDNEKDREKLSVNFDNNTLQIKKAKTLDLSCAFNKDVITYLVVYIPKDLDSLNVEIDSMIAHLRFDQVEYNLLTYRNLNGDLSLSNSNIVEVGLTTINGSMSLQNNEITTSEIQLTNGLIEIKNLKADETVLKNVNGNIEMADSIILKQASVSTTNGSVEINNLNRSVLEDQNLGLSVKTVNGSLTLQDVYGDQVYLKTTNGGITYKNTNQEFNIASFKYDQVTGSHTFDINAQINKNN